MAWWCLDLGDAWLASDGLERLQQQYRLFLQSGEGGDLRLWQRHESEGQLHCRLTVYFPPEAAAFAGFVAAQPCPEPGKTGLSELSLGHTDKDHQGDET